MKKLFRLSALILSILMIVSALVGCSLPEEVNEENISSILDVLESFLDEESEDTQEPPSETTAVESTTAKTENELDENGSYSSKDDVALYIHTYGKLPSNFIKKADAQKLGWTGGSLEPYAPGKSIGGDRFGNYEGLLPEKAGRTYTECDIDTCGASSRGVKRIVFSSDGLIYYTDDHYETFTKLYGGN